MAALIQLAPGTTAHGMAGMLASLIRQNVDEHEGKAAAFGRLCGRVTIVASDANAAATLVFEGGRLTVHDGLAGLPDVIIRASTEDITRMSLIELDGRWGLPNPRAETTHALWQAARAGRIQIRNAARNVPLLLRLTRVMSVH